MVKGLALRSQMARRQKVIVRLPAKLEPQTMGYPSIMFR